MCRAFTKLELPLHGRGRWKKPKTSPDSAPVRVIKGVNRARHLRERSEKYRELKREESAALKLRKKAIEPALFPVRFT